MPHAKIILAQFDVPDHPGAVVPILEVLNRHHVNISYISSQSNDSGHASLKMGLYIEEPGVMDTLLRELSALCPVQILSYDSGEKSWIRPCLPALRVGNPPASAPDAGADERVHLLREPHHAGAGRAERAAEQDV